MKTSLVSRVAGSILAVGILGSGTRSVIALPVPAVPVQNAEPPVPTTPTEFFQEQLTAIDIELAALLQRRTDLASAGGSMLDYEIDRRIIKRWLLDKACNANADLQACLALRLKNLQLAGDLIVQRLQTSGTALAATQVEGLKKLHASTYNLPDIKNEAVVDQACRDFATTFILIANPDPSEVKKLPVMRPVVRAVHKAVTLKIAPPTLAELCASAASANVSAALKKQLNILAAAATAASVDEKQNELLPSLMNMLGQAVDLVDGLQHNTGIDAAARPKLEQNLTDSLALFNDSRTRTIGATHISTLNNYRQTLVQLQQLKLSPTLAQKLAPTLVWVTNNPDSASKLLEPLEKYLELCARRDARPAAPSFLAYQKKTYDSLQKQFALDRAGFLEDANVDAAGFGPPVPKLSSLKARIQTMPPDARHSGDDRRFAPRPSDIDGIQAPPRRRHRQACRDGG